MADIDKASLDLITDRVAYIWGALLSAITGGTSFYDTVTATEDPDVELPLGQPAYDQDQSVDDGAWRAHLLDRIVNGLLAHGALESDTKADVYASLSALLTAVATRVHADFNLAQYQVTAAYITAALVYDEVKEMGLFSVTGSGTGTFADGLALSALTGGNNLEAYIPADKTATNVVLDVTCRIPGAATEVKRITVNGDEFTAPVAIGTPDTNIYTDITAVAIVSGGVNGERVGFRSIEDRVPAL